MAVIASAALAMTAIFCESYSKGSCKEKAYKYQNPATTSTRKSRR
jgi:hypothetical protein